MSDRSNLSSLENSVNEIKSDLDKNSQLSREEYFNLFIIERLNHNEEFYNNELNNYIELLENEFLQYKKNITGYSKYIKSYNKAYERIYKTCMKLIKKL